VDIYVRSRQATDENIMRPICFACWIKKGTDTHSEYVILIAFPLQKWSRQRASNYVIRTLSVFSIKRT
jgi:hypothetical protein